MKENRKIILENGEEYYGFAFGDVCDRVCEIVFNTSIVGYQEIFSDPSYADQAVVTTYPLIGNYGMADDDYESEIPAIGAFVVREYNDEPSNFRSACTLAEAMRKFRIPGIYGVDTRKLARSIRDYGSRRALLTDAETTLEKGLEIIKNTPAPRDAVGRVSTKTMQKYDVENAKFHVVAVDCGIKRNIVRSLTARGCRVTAVPFNTAAEEIEKLAPDGILVSNGPGDPVDVPETIATVRALMGKYPMFGVCLGHQIISLAVGGKTYKLKFGHRGGNHPVLDIETQKIEITSQNHSYAVDADSLAGTPLKVTHINLLDNTVEGAQSKEMRTFSVQYHPESAPGPEDGAYLFDRFVSLMENEKNA